MTKLCKKCNQDKEESLFVWSLRDGYGNVCKPCAAIYASQKRQDINYVFKQKAKKYNTDVDTIKTLFDTYKSCQICNEQDRRELCVDHDHVTGKVRGLLCDNCNKALGLFKDNSQFLTNAIRYLGAHSEEKVNR